MRKYLLFTLNSIQDFIADVQADGGFVVARSHTARVFRVAKDADLICSMSAGDTNKLYFEKHEP